MARLSISSLTLILYLKFNLVISYDIQLIFKKDLKSYFDDKPNNLCYKQFQGYIDGFMKTPRKEWALKSKYPYRKES